MVENDALMFQLSIMKRLFALVCFHLEPGGALHPSPAPQSNMPLVRRFVYIIKSDFFKHKSEIQVGWYELVLHKTSSSTKVKGLHFFYQLIVLEVKVSKNL